MKLLTENLEIGTFIKEQLESILPVYPIIADKGSEGSFCVYRRTGFVAKDSKDMWNYEETINLEIIIASQTYKDSIKLAQLIKDKLEAFRGHWRATYINNIVLDNCNEDWSNDSYIQRLYFTINIDNEMAKRKH